MKNNDIVPGFDDELDNYFTIRLKVIDKRPGCLMLFLKGKFGIQSTQLFQRRLAKAIKWGYVRLIFQLEGVDFRWSGNDELREAITDLIGSLTAFIKAVKPRGGDVVLIKVPPELDKTLKLIEVEKFFNIKGDIDDAVAFFIDEKHSNEY